MKKLFKLLLAVVFICALIYLAPKLVHKCDSCEDWFTGTGYEANIIADVVSDDDQTICKSFLNCFAVSTNQSTCAKKCPAKITGHDNTNIM